MRIELNKLESIRELADNNIQEAVNELFKIIINLEDDGIIEPDEHEIWHRYMMFGNFQSSDIINEYDFKLRSTYFYENTNDNIKEGIIIKEITKESILNTVAQFEKEFKIA